MMIWLMGFAVLGARFFECTRFSVAITNPHKLGFIGNKFKFNILGYVEWPFRAFVNPREEQLLDYGGWWREASKQGKIIRLCCFVVKRNAAILKDLRSINSWTQWFSELFLSFVIQRLMLTCMPNGKGNR